MFVTGIPSSKSVVRDPTLHVTSDPHRRHELMTRWQSTSHLPQRYRLGPQRAGFNPGTDTPRAYASKRILKGG